MVHLSYSETDDYSENESDQLLDNGYDNCEEKLNCKIPDVLTDLQGIITYSDPANCPVGTICRNSQKCGAKGNYILNIISSKIFHSMKYIYLL